MKIGIIAGSGMNDPTILQNRKTQKVTTPYGDPSDVLISGVMSGVECVFIARHGLKHTIPPSKVNYRANVWALKEAGCNHILACTACGGLQEYTQPGDFVVLDQFIDRTRTRDDTFYDGTPGHLEGVLHMPMEKPFCEELRKIFTTAALASGGQLVTSTSTVHGDGAVSNIQNTQPYANQKLFRVHPKGCVVTIEGPRFSTQAESILFHQWGADVINMTTVPEVVLAKELGLSYAAIAMVTDYDSWHPVEDAVSVDSVLQTFRANSQHMKNILINAVPKVAGKDWSQVILNNHKTIANSRQDLAAHRMASNDHK